MLTFVEKYAKNYFASQNGEEGLLVEIIKRLKIEYGVSVEIGGNNGLYCSNTALLLKEHGWTGLFVEYDYNLYLESKKNWAGNPRVRSQCSKVDGKNINAFVDERCDLLSLDTDGNDYEIFAGLQSFPKIVIVEIDSSVPPGVTLRDDGLGCTYDNTVTVGRYKHYFLLCHTGNLIFIRNDFRDLFPEVEGDPLEQPELYFNRSWLREEVLV